MTIGMQPSKCDTVKSATPRGVLHCHCFDCSTKRFTTVHNWMSSHQMVLPAAFWILNRTPLTNAASRSLIRTAETRLKPLPCAHDPSPSHLKEDAYSTFIR